MSSASVSLHLQLPVSVLYPHPMTSEQVYTLSSALYLLSLEMCNPHSLTSCSICSDIIVLRNSSRKFLSRREPHAIHSMSACALPPAPTTTHTFFFFFLFSTDLEHARQELYHLSHGPHLLFVLLGLASNLQFSCHHLPSRWDYRHAPHTWLSAPLYTFLHSTYHLKWTFFAITYSMSSSMDSFALLRSRPGTPWALSKYLWFE
jgi:hypothetical protein